MANELLATASAAQKLIQQACGIVGAISELPPREARLPALVGSIAQTGRLSVLYPPEGGLRAASWSDVISKGHALDLDKSVCNTRAVFEALERYASSVFVKDEVITASQNELGSAALDLSLVPKCSALEYADPKCQLRPADPSRPIRWVKAIELTTGRDCYVPLVISHLYVRPNRDEFFWNQISTGVAAHTSMQAAIISAILEVVERDAIALTWLAKIPLPEVLPDNGEALRLLTLAQRSGCRFNLFDATTDIGIPTIYGIQRRPYHPDLAQLVACSTGYSGENVYRKTLFELAQLNHVDWGSSVPPADIEDIVDLIDGARFMAKPENASAFDFISSGKHSKKLSNFENIVSEDDSSVLADLTSRLARIGAETYLVNLTTDDLRDAGVHVVRAFIPSLMPMSPIYRARYLGHPRLYEYARKVGLSDFNESKVNKFPQPFA